MIEYNFVGEYKLCDETFTTKEKLEDHISDDHQQDLATQDLRPGKSNCNNCEQSNLMVHKKQHHTPHLANIRGHVDIEMFCIMLHE